jgi:hypothetical protein
MKKLLALILCVMMFVSVIPTSAFALTGIIVADQTIEPTTNAKEWAGKMAATKAVEKMNDAVKAMYGAIAANQGVFTTVKAIDDTVKELSENLFKDIDTLTLKDKDGNNVVSVTTNKGLVDTTKEFLKEHIGGEITKYMNDHKTIFSETKDDGSVVIDPVKYMNTFATAASKAMSSEKAVKNIEAVAYLGAYAKAQKEAKDKMEDLYNDYQAWGGKYSDYGWANITGNTGWDPYVLVDAQNPYMDYSNFNKALGDWVNDYTDSGITEYPASTSTSTNPIGPGWEWYFGQ